MTLADIRVGLRAYILASGTIAAAVDSGASAVPRYRVFPSKLPQGELRASIVYSRISGLTDHHSTGPSGLSRPRIQIDCWAPTQDAAASLADLVKERIDGFSGSVQWDDNSPGNAVVIQSIMFADRESDDYDDAVKLYRTGRDYFVWYEER